jgi:hypothetical protein
MPHCLARSLSGIMALLLAAVELLPAQKQERVESMGATISGRTAPRAPWPDLPAKEHPPIEPPTTRKGATSQQPPLWTENPFESGHIAEPNSRH